MLVGMPVMLYSVTPRALSGLGITDASLGLYPVGLGARDTLTYFLNPNKRGDDSAARFARGTLDHLAEGALVFTPKTSEQETYVVLRYFQKVEGQRPDVHLDMMLFDPQDSMPAAVLEKTIALAACRPLYYASLNPASFPVAQVSGLFDLAVEANLYRLRSLNTHPPPADCAARVSNPGKLSMDELVRRALRWQ
jgi:hypothetical protein